MTKKRRRPLAVLAALALAASGLAAPHAAAAPTPKLAPGYDFSREKGGPGTHGPLSKNFSTNTIKVKFRTERQVRLRSGRFSASASSDTAQIRKILADYPGATIRPLSSRPEKAISDERARLEKRSGRALPDLNSWFVITVPKGIETLLSRLNALPSVELARAASKSTPADETFRPAQLYRNAVGAAAGTGLDVDAINSVPGGKGDDVTVADAEGVQSLLVAYRFGAVAAGTAHSVLVDQDGFVWATGSNDNGQLGDGTKTNSKIVRKVAGLSDVKAVAAAGDYTVALTNSGTVWAWGDNANGQLGNGTTTDSPTPVQVTGLLNATAISAGPDGHVLAVLSSGQVKAWGANGSGQLGDGTTTQRTSPVTVAGLSGVATGFGAVGAGNGHSLAVLADGRVQAWGGNASGQLGDGTTTGHLAPANVTGISDAKQVAAGGAHSLALTSAGAVRAWGANQLGQLGDGTTTSRLTPVNISLSEKATSVAAGSTNSAATTYDAVTGDGTGNIWVWGDNSYGQVGNGTTTNAATPAQVSGIGAVFSVALGARHSVADSYFGFTVWGSNSVGQFGTGDTTSHLDPKLAELALSSWNTCHEEFTNRPAIAGPPVIVPPVAGNTCAGTSSQVEHGTAVASIIGARADNNAGIAGIAPNTHLQLTLESHLSESIAALHPGDVLLYETHAGGTLNGLYPKELEPDTYALTQIAVANGITVVEVAGNGGKNLDDPADFDAHTIMGRPDSGAIMVGAGAPPSPSGTNCLGANPPVERSAINLSWWGSNYGSRVDVQAYGSCVAAAGTLTYRDLTSNVNDPNKVYRSMFNGTSSASAIMAGAVATVQGVAKKYGGPLEPAQVRQILKQTGTPQAPGDTRHIGPQPNLRAVVSYLRGGLAVGSSHAISVRNDGSVWAWGLNSSGQLGNGTTVNSTSGVQVSGLSGVVRAPGAVAAGQNHSLAVRADGTVWAWGANGSGQLGNGSTANSSVPVQVSGLTGVKAVAAGLSFSLALKSDGTVWAWGANASGQLGNGSTTGSSTPVQVSGISDTAVIGAGSSHGLAVRADGTVKAWGANSNGQLGNGSNTNSSTPVSVSGLSGVSTWAGSLAGGFAHSVALLADGTVRAWGLNNYGQLGNGSTTSSNIPVTVSGLTGVATVGAGGWHSVASGTSGVSKAWGMNTSGQLGDGSTTSSSTPVVVSDWGPLAGVAAGGSSTTGTTPAGTVFAWGLNSSGQLGDGTTTNRSTPVFVNDLP
ncbi:RCC1 domain-containing protein [Actinomadura rubteroloni]|nr:S8 family serine peptidase [Actinomadura rubteroloni]